MDSDRVEIINTINKCFGDFGWSFSISNVFLDYVEENRSGNYAAGASAVVRVQQSDGIFREALGYGWSFGSIKAEVISKAKKDAVNDGLRGAAVNFGGNIAKSMSQYQATVKKTGNSIAAEASPQNRINAAPPTISQTATRQSSFARNIVDVQGSSLAQGVNAPLAPLITSPVMAPKPGPAPVLCRTSPVAPKSPPRVSPTPRISPPLAMPLASAANQLSEEELAKIERKRRQRQRQEEFRQKHLVEKAQAQTKAVEKKLEPQQSRAPLKEQQLLQPSSNQPTDNGNNANTLDVDDDVLLSTQDMEAVVQIAANNSNVSRRSPMISSPSHNRPFSEVSKQPSRLSTAHKRPDLSNYAFNAEKKPRGMQ